MAFWDSIMGGMDNFFSDPKTYQQVLAKLISENPKLPMKKIQELARQQMQMSAPNYNTPFGGQTTTFDPETGQPTVTETLPQGVLDLGNAMARRMGGQPNTIRQAGPGTFARSAGQGLMNSWERGRNMPETTHAWWEPTPREEVDVGTPFVNPPGGLFSGSPITSGPTGGTGSQGSDRDMTGIQPEDELFQGNDEYLERYYDDPNTVMDQHRGIFEREGLGQEYDTLKNYYESLNTGVPWGEYLAKFGQGFLAGGPVGGILYAAARYIDDKFLLSERSILEEIPTLGQYRMDGPFQGETDIPYKDLYPNQNPIPPQDTGNDEETLLDYSFLEEPAGIPAGSVPPGTGVQMGGRTAGSRITSYYIGGRRVTKAEYEAYIASKSK